MNNAARAESPQQQRHGPGAHARRHGAAQQPVRHAVPDHLQRHLHLGRRGPHHDQHEHPDGRDAAVELGGTTPGTQHDLFDINGSAILDGLLTLRFIDAFENAVLPSHTFTILTADAPITGAFANRFAGNRIATANGVGRFLVSTDGNRIVLSDFNTMVPEPGSAALVAAAAALAAHATTARPRRRRRRGG